MMNTKNMSESYLSVFSITHNIIQQRKRGMVELESLFTRATDTVYLINIEEC